MALVVLPGSVEKDGGYKITLTGIGLVDGEYFFHVGPLSTHEDPRAYAGSYGTGDVVTVAGASATFVTPPIDDPGAYSISAFSTSTPTTSGTVLPSGLAYHNKNHRNVTFSYRTLQQSWVDTGPRDIVEEKPQ